MKNNISSLSKFFYFVAICFFILSISMIVLYDEFGYSEFQFMLRHFDVPAIDMIINGTWSIVFMLASVLHVILAVGNDIKIKLVELGNLKVDEKKEAE